MERERRSFPLVLSAPSGGGKTAIRERLLSADKRFRFSVTCTTRPRRPGERDGKDYYFVTPEEFRRLRRAGKLLEWARVHGNMYGTPVRSVKAVLDKGFVPVMTIDVKGARAVRKAFPDAVTVFLLPPDLATLVERLRKRGEPEAGMKVRFGTARKELRESVRFDYLVVNDRLSDAVSDVRKIADAEMMRVSRRGTELRRFSRELSYFRI
ncbi:MAG TPA: guanylate kinase [Elusimicrobiales bacterium]|nr:guanylate kinase [Elusimicrobiales bacterium]